MGINYTCKVCKKECWKSGWIPQTVCDECKKKG